MQRTDAALQSANKAIHDLGVQISQVAMDAKRVQGTLPSQTVVNPKENVNAIEVVFEEERDCPQEEEPRTQEKEIKEPNMLDKEEEASAIQEEQEPITISIVQSEDSKALPHKYVPPHARHEGRMKEAIQEEQESTKAEHTKQPSTMRNAEYKELPPPPFPNRLKNAKLDKPIQEIPPLLKDPGKFTIPCTLGSLKLNALCDLGSSINLMPFSIFKKLGGEGMKPTKASLLMADQSMKKPLGELGGVLIKVCDFIFPIEFIILDMKEDEDVPIILGRPFLATSRALINVEKGELTLRMLEEKVSFSIQSPFKFPTLTCASSFSTPSPSSFSHSRFVVDGENDMIDQCKREYGGDVVAKFKGKIIPKTMRENKKGVDEFEREDKWKKRNPQGPIQTVGYVSICEDIGTRETPKDPPITKPPTLARPPPKFFPIDEKEVRKKVYLCGRIESVKDGTFESHTRFIHVRKDGSWNAPWSND